MSVAFLKTVPLVLHLLELFLCLLCLFSGGIIRGILLPLGGAMQNLIVENENAAKQWIRFLQQKHAGRATFLIVPSFWTL